MMKTPLLTLAVASVLTLAAPAFAADQMANMKGMAAAGAAKTGHGAGIVTAVDAKATSITIKHGPIPGVGWPAMTMTFKADPPRLLQGVKAGEKVGFDVRVQGSSAQVTSLVRE